MLWWWHQCKDCEWFQLARGKVHGSLDVSLAVMSVNKKSKRIDLDAGDGLYHVKVRLSLVSPIVTRLMSHSHGFILCHSFRRRVTISSTSGWPNWRLIACLRRTKLWIFIRVFWRLCPALTAALYLSWPVSLTETESWYTFAPLHTLSFPSSRLWLSCVWLFLRILIMRAQRHCFSQSVKGHLQHLRLA